MASRLKIPRAKSSAEETFALHLRLHKMPAPKREFAFHATRKWRFDFAWPEAMVAVEIEGLTRPGTKSRHTTNAGYTADMEKYNAAALDGWCVLRFDQRAVNSTQAALCTAKALERAGHGVVIPTR